IAVYFLVAEPKRGAYDHGPQVLVEARFFSNPVLLLASLASGAANFITYGLNNFATLFLMREKGMELSDVAIWYALVIGLGMGAGIFISGRLVDRFGARAKAAYAIIPAISL